MSQVGSGPGLRLSCYQGLGTYPPRPSLGFRHAHLWETSRDKSIFAIQNKKLNKVAKRKPNKVIKRCNKVRQRQKHGVLKTF